MNPIDRAKNIIATPKSEWPVIASETVTLGDLYARFIVPLAAIPVLAQFTGGLLFGYPILRRLAEAWRKRSLIMA
jgi:hypothetical protein